MNPNTPIHPVETMLLAHTGLTIRDHIAIEAMKAIIIAKGEKETLSVTSKLAYLYADALIAESNKKN